MTQPIGTIGDLVRFGADRFGAAPAVVGPNATLTYADLARRVEHAASALRSLPCGGGYLAVLAGSKVTLALSFYAGAAAGFATMLCPEDLPLERLRSLLRRYRPAAVVLDSTSAAKAAGALTDFTGAVFTVGAGDGWTILRGAERPARGAVAEAEGGGPVPDAEALVLFTSGTTGDKKAVPITHRNLLETGAMINRFMGLDGPIRELVTVPLTHAFGLRRVICVHLTGGAVLVDDRPFNPARALQLLRDERCTGLSAVPAVLALMRGTFPAELSDLGSQVGFVELGSAPLSARGKAALCEIFPKAQLCMHYGLTEASKVTFLHLFRDAHKLHTVGRPSPGVQVKVADETGTPAVTGTAGEVWARGFNVVTRYLDEPELSRQRFVDGWFRTGDLARADADGYLELLGRMDEMINVGGRKMYPQEAESVLKEAYPDIDCAVWVEAHEYLGARPILYYSEATPVSPDLFRDMVGHLTRRLETYKIPLRAKSLPAIPRTPNGKIVRHDLARLIRTERA